MKRAWIAGLVVVLALPAVAAAQDGVAAWCGGSYGARGTNFGECVTTDRDVQLAGQGSGFKPGMTLQTRPEYPSAMVTFEDGKATFVDSASGVKQPLNLSWGQIPDYASAIQSPGGDSN